MAPSENQAATENTNLNLRSGKEPVYSPFVTCQDTEAKPHVLILSEWQPHRVLREYVETYCNSARPHQGLS